MYDYIRRRRLKSVKLGIAGGVTLGFSLAISTLMAVLFPGYGTLFHSILESIYPWYSVSILGSFIIFFWGFLDAFLFLWITGTLYNWLTKWGYGCPGYPNKTNTEDGENKS